MILKIISIIKDFFRRFLKRKDKKEYWLDNELYRTAAHEAGHAIVSWYCIDVERVEKIIINDYKGCVFHLVRKGAFFERAVISLAGIAAEVFLYKKFRSGPAKDDLIKSKFFIEKIIKNLDDTQMSTPINVPMKLDFQKMFASNLTKQELLLFNKAYSTACNLIKYHQDKYFKLINELLLKKSLNNYEIEKILGSRLSIFFLKNFSEGFLPKSCQNLK